MIDDPKVVEPVVEDSGDSDSEDSSDDSEKEEESTSPPQEQSEETNTPASAEEIQTEVPEERQLIKHSPLFNSNLCFINKSDVPVSIKEISLFIES